VVASGATTDYYIYHGNCMGPSALEATTDVRCIWDPMLKFAKQVNVDYCDDRTCVSYRLNAHCEVIHADVSTEHVAAIFLWTVSCLVCFNSLHPCFKKNMRTHASTLRR
jgi:hypothetical protein